MRKVFPFIECIFADGGYAGKKMALGTERPGRAQMTRCDEPAPVILFHGVKGAEGGVRAFSVAVVVLLPGCLPLILAASSTMLVRLDALMAARFKKQSAEAAQDTSRAAISSLSGLICGSFLKQACARKLGRRDRRTALLLGAADRRRVFGAQDGGRSTSFHVSKSPRTRLIRCYNRSS